MLDINIEHVNITILRKQTKSPLKHTSCYMRWKTPYWAHISDWYKICLGREAMEVDETYGHPVIMKTDVKKCGLLYKMILIWESVL
jgi:hypothetical protein